MAQRAAQRIDLTAPAPDPWREAHQEARRQALAELDSLTLGEAVANLRSYVPYGCACPGPPVCCWEYNSRYRDTKRAAHIAIKQIAELARRKGQA